MSADLVHADTGELLDPEAAERRAQRIGLDLDATADRFEAAMDKLRAAIRDRDDLALGYRSPGDYVSQRFGGQLARLGVDLRREVVRELTEAGMSTRAIAPVVGVSDVQVHHDRHAGAKSVSTSDTPAPSPGPSPTADDGDNADWGAEPVDGEALRQAGINVSRPKPPKRTTGTDGKSYPKSKPAASKPHRKPLPDAFFHAAYDLGKCVERLDRLVEDDRFPSNAEKVGSKHRADLLRAVELLSKALDRLPSSEER